MATQKLTFPVLALAALAACSSGKRSIRIPDSVVPNPKNKDSVHRTAIQPYVVKMSDGKNVYQVEIPVSEASGPISTSIPIETGAMDEGEGPPQTEADREIIEAKKAAGEPIPSEKPGEPPKARSYLGTIARVNELFKKRQYELALMELIRLDRQYPDDERILSMKGSIYQKLNRPKQARQAWERVLALNPNNTAVAQALEQLNQEGE